MSELRERLKKEFADQEYREAYAEDFLNTSIATQIKVIREQREMTQGELADKIGTKQAGISRSENVNYAAWKIETLKKIAFALGCRLKVSIETFGSLLDEAETFSREALQRVSFENDLAFKVQPEIKRASKSTVIQVDSSEVEQVSPIETSPLVDVRSVTNSADIQVTMELGK
jgi:transcriptional regulator with XRE-family HTH domain